MLGSLGPYGKGFSIKGGLYRGGPSYYKPLCRRNVYPIGSELSECVAEIGIHHHDQFLAIRHPLEVAISLNQDPSIRRLLGGYLIRARRKLSCDHGIVSHHKGFRLGNIFATGKDPRCLVPLIWDSLYD